VIFLEPPAIDRRILNQHALFSLFSSPESQLDEWLGDNPRLYRKVRIPSSLKWEIRDKLDQGNVNERVLFPGLDGTSRWLARYYKPFATRAKAGVRNPSIRARSPRRPRGA
jgi:hypothetical protein